MRYLQANPQELDLQFKELLIGVTSFFRDPVAWDHLATGALPDLLSRRAGSGVIRAWVPGCSTGEEAYSLAIVLKEALAQQKAPLTTRLQIFATDLFTPIGPKARSFLRRDTGSPSEQFEFPASFHAQITAPGPAATTRPPTPDIQALAARQLLEHHTPAAVITKALGDILYISGRTGKYLEPAAGKANWNVHAMAREGLGPELDGVIRQARRSERPVTCRVALRSRGLHRSVEVRVDPLRDPEALRGLLLIVFKDVSTSSKTRPRRRTGKSSATVAQLEKELTEIRAELQATREDMQSSQEELKSATEELQSTNEELTTSKEGMQSLNEELQTLNNELQAKVNELSRANDDLRNLLNSTDIATLFLDTELKVRRFTSKMTDIFRQLPGDLERPITDLVSDLDYPNLATDARQVLETLVFKESQAKTSSGRWYTVRTMPYRTVDNRIDGLVITFVDITASKKLEEKLRAKPVE